MKVSDSDIREALLRKGLIIPTAEREVEIAEQTLIGDSRICLKCGHEERYSDNEGGLCEKTEGALLRDGKCGCYCEFHLAICAQCESNARWNDAGGYHGLAEKCREYCRRGHKE
jgi:hypothetical protein